MLTTEQLRARAKFWREKAVDAKWESVSIAQDMLQNADAFDELAANREAQPVEWEMRYWNSGYNMWHDWERITAEQYTEMNAQHVTDNDYDFRVLYDAAPAPAVPDCFLELLKHAGGMAMGTDWNSGTAAKYHRTKLCEAVNACRAAMLAN